MDNLCELITKSRKERGITQNELGKMLGISGKAVSKWERGLSKPCDEHLKKLVNLLGLPVELCSTESPKLYKNKTTLLSTIRGEFLRILAIGFMLASCLCNLTGIISTDSTVVYLGFSVSLFCFDILIKG